MRAGRNEERKTKFVEVHPQVFVRGHTRHLDSTTVLDACREKRITWVLNVALKGDDIMAAACRTIGIRYQHVPMSDSRHMDETQVRTLINEVVEHLKRGCNILIHCDSGWNRSNLIALSAVYHLTGELPHRLIARARETRPRTLHNRVFEKFVLNMHSCPYEVKGCMCEHCRAVAFVGIREDLR